MDDEEVNKAILKDICQSLSKNSKISDELISELLDTAWEHQHDSTHLDLLKSIDIIIKSYNEK